MSPIYLISISVMPEYLGSITACLAIAVIFFLSSREASVPFAKWHLIGSSRIGSFLNGHIFILLPNGSDKRWRRDVCDPPNFNEIADMFIPFA